MDWPIAYGGELGVQIVEIMKGHGFTDHGQLRRAKLVLAVMTDEEMLDDRL